MHFARTEEQDELTSTLAALLSKRSDSASVRAAIASDEGFDGPLWQTMCEQIGVAALPVPEEYGGAGFGLDETVVVLEEIGRALTPSPLLATTVATVALLLHGSEEARRDLLPRLAAGEVGTVVWDGAASVEPTSTVTAEGERLSGQAALVLDAAGASILLVVADGTLWRVAPADASITPLTSMDQTVQLCAVTLDGARAAPVGAVSDLRPLHAVGAALATAVQIGVARRGLDMTVGHTREREQFGRPIASFQALKHRMADLLVLVESGRSAAWAAGHAAASYVARPGPETEATLLDRAHVSQAYCSGALDQVASETVQLHGGIAITWEHDAQLVLKRARALSQLFGQAHEHRGRAFDTGS
jgi:alkylation response protein AidB-like acyl-CoA dehydrogenase